MINAQSGSPTLSTHGSSELRTLRACKRSLGPEASACRSCQHCKRCVTIRRLVRCPLVVATLASQHDITALQHSEAPFELTQRSAVEAPHLETCQALLSLISAILQPCCWPAHPKLLSAATQHPQLSASLVFCWFESSVGNT